MLCGRTKAVHVLSNEFTRRANVVHRPLEPFHCSIHYQCSPWRNSGERCWFVIIVLATGVKGASRKDKASGWFVLVGISSLNSIQWFYTAALALFTSVLWHYWLVALYLCFLWIILFPVHVLTIFEVKGRMTLWLTVKASSNFWSLKVLLIFYHCGFFFLSCFLRLISWGHWTNLNQTFTHIHLWLLLKNLRWSPMGVYPPQACGKNRFLGPSERLRTLTENTSATEHGINNRKVTRQSTGNPQIWWSLVHKRPRTAGDFLPTLLKFAHSLRAAGLHFNLIIFARWHLWLMQMPRIWLALMWLRAGLCHASSLCINWYQ